MAAQVVKSPPGLKQVGDSEKFTKAIDELITLSRAATRPIAIEFTRVHGFKIGNLSVWEAAVKGKKESSIGFHVDLIRNTVTVHPDFVDPFMTRMSLNSCVSDAETTAVGDGNDADDIESAKAKKPDKIPRPQNCFILYRTENHPKIAAMFPNMHNNDISKLIADNWHAETKEVKDEYKRKAEDAKRNHFIQHPGYQYQPRKAGEKKKRMTKAKLAKQLQAAVDPASLVPNRNYITQQELPVFENFDFEGGTRPSFDAMAPEDFDAYLATAISSFNNCTNTMPGQIATNSPINVNTGIGNANIVAEGGVAIQAVPTVNGQLDIHRTNLPDYSDEINQLTSHIDDQEIFTTSANAFGDGIPSPKPYVDLDPYANINRCIDIEADGQLAMQAGEEDTLGGLEVWLN